MPKFVIVCKKGPGEIFKIWGNKEVNEVDIHQLLLTEQFLEKVTGYRWHLNVISEVPEGEDDVHS